MRVLTRCSRESWLSRYAAAYEADPRMQAACHKPEFLASEVDDKDAEFISILDESGHVGGYVIQGGRLLGVHCSVRGLGWWIMLNAAMDGAQVLDTFAGSRMHDLALESGWVETGREPNWNAGQPDVVTLERP